MRLDPITSDRIKLMALWCSVLICFNHAYTLDHPYLAVAGSTSGFIDHHLQNMMKYGIARISTPFFFTVAAFMLFTAFRASSWNWTIYGSELRKRIRTLAVPFLCWAVLSFVLMASLQSIPAFKPYFTRFVLDSAPVDYVRYLLWQPVAYQLWFVRHLMLLVLVSPVIFLLVRNRRSALVWFVLCTIAWCGWHAHFTTRAVLFFSFGAFLAIHRPAIRVPAWSMSLWVALWMISACTYSLYIMHHAREHGVLNNLTIILGLLASWTVSERLVAGLMSRPLVRTLSGMTFFIYAAHEPLASLLRKALIAGIGLEHQLSYLAAWIMVGSATFALAVIAAFLLQHYLPRVYGVLAGGRSDRPRPGLVRSAPIAIATPIPG